jgi:outer membrane protein TolC
MKSVFRFGTIGVLASMMASGSHLAVAEDQTLSFDEAVMHALQSAPQIAARTESAAAMRELSVSAGRLPDPALMVGIDNLPVDGPDAWSTTTDFMTMRGISVMQEFPNRKKLGLERDRAAAEVELADAELVETRLVVARLAAQAWIRSAAVESALEHLRSLRSEVELGVAASRAGVAGGLASTAEALAAESAVVRLQDRIIELETAAHHSRTDLARWVGEDAARPLGPMPAFDRLPEPASVLLAEVERHGPILPFESRLAEARSDVELARADKRPDWRATLGYSDRGPDFSNMVSFQVTVDLPIFARNRQDPVIAARSAELRQIEADREAMLREHLAELHKVLVEWEQTGRRLDHYDRELLPLARERGAAALAAYRAGRGDFQLALDAYTDEIDAAVERAMLADALGRAWAFLRYLEPRQLPR